MSLRHIHMARKIQDLPAELEPILRFLYNKLPEKIIEKEVIIRAIGEKIFNQYKDYLLDKHIIELGEGTSYNIKAKNLIDEFNNIRKDKFNEQLTSFTKILALGTVVLALGTMYPLLTKIFGENNIVSGILFLVILIITVILIFNFFKIYQKNKN